MFFLVIDIVLVLQKAYSLHGMFTEQTHMHAPKNMHILCNYLLFRARPYHSPTQAKRLRQIPLYQTAKVIPKKMRMIAKPGDVSKVNGLT